MHLDNPARTTTHHCATTMYGVVNEQIGNAFPEIRAADQPIASLIPVARHAETLSREAPLVQRVAQRFGARTGALTLGCIGAYGGYKGGGLPGAVAGGLAGAVGPEVLADPAAQIGVARLLNRAGAFRQLTGAILNVPRYGQQVSNTEGPKQPGALRRAMVAIPREVHY